MEGIVAKRTLKKSYYENNNLNYVLTNNESKKEGKKKSKTTLKEKIEYRLILKSITMFAIVSFVLSVKYLNISIVLNSDIAKNIKREYTKTYTKQEILNSSNKIIKSIGVYIDPIIPDKIKENINNIFVNFNKEKNNNNTNKNNEVLVYEEVNNNKSENKTNEQVTNVGVSVEEKDKVVSVSSSVSTEQEIVDKINKSGIKFVIPLKGVVTSNFGAREEIFAGIDSYHTGIDVGGNKGDTVVASISGEVTVATYNKYNGNYIEITNGKIITKYCHLSKITVKEGTKIKSGKKIGEVGSTGLSTGPHLHFEIVYDGVKINPAYILKF